MILFGLAVAFACFVAGCLLAMRAVRALWSSSGWVLARTPWGARTHAGVALADGETVTAPFSGRSALWVRARVVGPPPGGGPPRELWCRELSAPAVVRTKKGRVSVTWSRVRVIVPLEYRRGTEKVLEREAPVLSRVLSRAGYAERPAGSTFFELEEEVLAPGERVVLRGELGAAGLTAVPSETQCVLSSLDPWRLVLRQSWGPLLALWFSALAVASGGGVLLAAYWLRRGA